MTRPSPLRSTRGGSRIPLTWLCLLSALAFPWLAPAAEAPKRHFELDADLAANALRKFAAQSGTEVLFGTRTAEKVRTNAVRGDYTPYEAMKLLLAGTGLVTTQDRATGALTISADPNAQNAAPSGRALDSGKKKETQTAQNPQPMKKNNPLARLAGMIALVFTPVAHSAEGEGMIAGRILNATNGSYLEHAKVTIQDTSLVTFTDSAGEYRLAGVRAGPVKVTAFHTGLAGQTATVTVTAGQTTRQDFNLQAGEDRDGVVKLGAYVVSSSREMDGAAIAINERRFAPNVKDVVAADEFGPSADGNVGELLKFLPGVTLSYIGGEAAQISLDGVPPDNVPITVGGFDLASARINTRRAVELSQFSVNNVARIEVSHTPTPEITGTALAGSINMVPRSAFERARPLFEGAASVSMSDRIRGLSRSPGPHYERTSKVYPGFNFAYIRPVNERFGFTLSGAVSAQMGSLDWMSNRWHGVDTATNGTTFPNTTPDAPYRTAYQVRLGQILSRRSSLGTTLDFKLSPYDTLSVSVQYSYFHQFSNYHRQDFTITRVLPGDFSPTFTHGAPGSGTISVRETPDDKAGTTYMPSFIYRHNGPIWKAEAGAGLSHSTNVFANYSKGFFQFSTRSRSGVTIAFDGNSPLRPTQITVTDAATGAPINPYDINNAPLTSAGAASYQANATQRSAFANARRDFFGRVPLAVKTGLDIRQAVRDRRRRDTPTFTFVGADGRPGSADDGAAVVMDQDLSQLPAPYGFPSMGWVSNKALVDLYKAHPGYFLLDEVGSYNTEVTASQYAEEIISSAYLRGDAQFFDRRLKLVGGVRAEQTNVKGEGMLTDRTRNQQRDATGKLILDANGRPIPITTSPIEAAKLTNVDRGLHTKKEYLRWFPSLNASFDVRPNLIARVGYYWSIGRPNLGQYGGTLTIPDPESPPSASNRFSVNNAGIKAWNARSTKATLEYYFGRVGILSVGAFRRDIDNFFVSTTFKATPEFLALYGLRSDIYDGYDVVSQINSPNKVRMEGYNVSYKQSLTFMPEWARGVQVFANYSALRAIGPGANDFAGYIPRTVNWGVSLSRSKYDLKINWNFRDRARTSLYTGASIGPGTYSWDGRRLYIDASADYYLSKRIALFVSVRNLNDASVDFEVWGPSTPQMARLSSREENGGSWVLGVKGSF